MSADRYEQAFSLAMQQYADLGVDANAALATLATIPISLHCWQGDDIGGFEAASRSLGGGLAVTGNYPGKATTPGQLRGDLDKALSLIPGRHRVNLHAMYGEFGGETIDRDAVAPAHFANWIDWARQKQIGLDFNPSFFSHPMAADGFTLSNADDGIRRFWVDHGIACRHIGAAIGRALGNPCVTNYWVPDGYKDSPIDRLAPRRRLAESLDTIFSEVIDPTFNLDAVEGKLFGIGSESYVVGSHEFYFGYAMKNKKLVCLDAGHYHPTETITDKLSSVLMFSDRVLLHVSRGVRWDSDHVVTLNDDLLGIAQELVRGGYLGRTHIGLDFFDASINRVAAWTIGTRNMIKALLIALLEPIDRLRAAENAGDYTSRLALLEDAKTLPFGAVWEYYCQQQNVPADLAWLADVKAYEAAVLSKR